MREIVERKPRNYVPPLTILRHMINDYNKALKLVSYTKKLESDIVALKEEIKELKAKVDNKKYREIQRENDSLRSRMKNYGKWKNNYNRMKVILQRHNIPFRLEMDLVEEVKSENY